MLYFEIGLIILLTVLAVLYIRYRMKPATQWASRVRTRVGDLRDRLDRLRRPSGSQSAAEKLADELFERQKKAVDVDVLQRGEGIGPAIVETLKAHGIRNLADAEGHANAFLLFKKKIENIGEVRERLIADAVKECLAVERRRFDSGQSEQGVEYQRRLETLNAQEREQAAAKAREIAAIERCLDRMSDLEDHARRVTFLGSLTGTTTGIDDALMAREFPKIEIADAPAVPVTVPSTAPATSPVTEISGLAHLQACCRFALLAAKADGRIAQPERATIRRVLGEQFGSDPVLLRHLDPQLEAAERDLPSEADAMRAIQSLTEPDEWLSLYRFAEQVIEAGGERNEKESQYLARIAAAFEITPAKVESPASPPPVKETKPATPGAREVLGIPANFDITPEAVRRRYKLLSEQYDPEKAKSLGAEFVAMAEAKRAAVKAAALELLAPLNAPLETPDAPPPPADLRHNPQLDDIFGANRG